MSDVSYLRVQLFMLPRERDGTGKCGSDAPTRLAALYLTNEDLNFIRDGIPSVVANLQPMKRTVTIFPFGRTLGSASPGPPTGVRWSRGLVNPARIFSPHIAATAITT